MRQAQRNRAGRKPVLSRRVCDIITSMYMCVIISIIPIQNTNLYGAAGACPVGGGEESEVVRADARAVQVYGRIAHLQRLEHNNTHTTEQRLRSRQRHST